MRLFDRKIKFNDKEFWLTIDKRYYSRVSGIDYYKYYCTLYKEVDSWFGVKKKAIFSYDTYWLDYTEYHGNIDKVIDETINHYNKNLREQKYISENESNFKSKYEV